MPISEDVLVIGGGLAGGVAALAAADTGRSVRLVSHTESTLGHASGLIDVLGSLPFSQNSSLIVNPFSTLSNLPSDHPYTVLDNPEAAVRDGLALFDEITGEMYAGDHTDANALVPTQDGAVKPTARYPRSVAPGLASMEHDTLLVGFESLPAFDGPLAADHLAACGVPYETAGITVPFPEEIRDDAKRTRLARALDHDETVRSALVKAVEPHLNGAERVGFPAMLGVDRPNQVRRALESQLGIPVFEVPGGPPSLPGRRLEKQLFGALEDAGVRMTRGVPVVGYETESNGNRIKSVLVDHNGTVPYYASQFVLATGGLVGKGIDSDRSGVREPIFDCHIPHPEDRYDWFVEEAFGDHPFTRFGIRTDEQLRPLAADGTTEFENLRAAGSVLGGANVAAEKSASGISLATGRRAGELAGRTDPL